MGRLSTQNVTDETVKTGGGPERDGAWHASSSSEIDCRAEELISAGPAGLFIVRPFDVEAEFAFEIALGLGDSGVGRY